MARRKDEAPAMTPADLAESVRAYLGAGSPITVLDWAGKPTGVIREPSAAPVKSVTLLGRPDWIKVFKVAPHAVLMVVNECAGGADSCAVRLEGNVFGAKGTAVKHFASPAAAAAFFEVYDQEAAEAWWRSLHERVLEEFEGFADRLIHGEGGPAPVGFFNWAGSRNV
jgi:hypothetical protein